jgi:ABC-type ATPase involved in cell division
MDHFLRLNQSGVTILMATHNPALAGHTTRHLKCHAGTLSESESGSRLNNQQSRGSL